MSARWFVKKAARRSVALGSFVTGTVGARTLAASGPRARVLTYHRIGHEPREPFCVSPDAFEAQMRFLSERRLAVNLDQLLAFVAGREALPDGACLVTIDDGCVSTLTEALPILRRWGVPAIAFVTSSLAGLDRSNFEGSEFRVPIDGTYHHPHNTLPIVTRDEQARQRGEFPTMETVLEQSDPSVFERWYEFIVIPAWNIVETAWLVPTLIIDGPWETTSSPSQIKGRTSPNPPMLTPGVIALTRAELDDINQANNTSGNATDE